MGVVLIFGLAAFFGFGFPAIVDSVARQVSMAVSDYSALQ